MDQFGKQANAMGKLGTNGSGCSAPYCDYITAVILCDLVSAAVREASLVSGRSVWT
jgi:hypothetical protein